MTGLPAPESPRWPTLEEGEAVALVARYQQREADSLAALHGFLAPAIRGIVGRYRPSDLPSAVTLQDIHQQSWIILAELAERWRPGGRFLAYFFRSFPRAISRYVQRARLKRRTVQVLSLPHDELLLALDRVQGPDLSGEAEASSWTDELASLPPAEQTAFLLHALDHQDFATIGRVLEVSSSSAHRFYRRALARLAGRLDASSGHASQPPMLRLVHALHAGAGADRALPGRRQVLVGTGLARQEYAALMAELEVAGAVAGRGPTRSGQLVDSSVAATLERLGPRS